MMLMGNVPFATLYLVHVLPPTPAGYFSSLRDADGQYLQTMGEIEQLFP